MNPPRESSKGNASPQSSSPQSSLTGMHGQFGDAYSKLVQTSQNAALQNRRQLEDSHLRLAKAISEIQADIRKRYAEADQEYCKVAQEAATRQDGGQDLQEAYQNFIETVKGLEEDERRRVEEVNAEFHAKLQESTQASEQQARENYQNYLRSIQQAWAGVDVSSLV